MVNDIDIKNKLDAFTEDMLNAYNEAFVEMTRRATESVERSYTDRLYNNSVLSRFTQFGVSKDSAQWLQSVFIMMGECDGIHPTDKNMIFETGRKYGFSEEESLCIYNMRRFEHALNNLRPQRELVFDYLTGLKE